eukprot:1464377-Rhodomonas_salina.1
MRQRAQLVALALIAAAVELWGSDTNHDSGNLDLMLFMCKSLSAFQTRTLDQREYAEFIGHRQSGLRALINPAESELVGGGGREAVHVRAFNSRSVPPSASALAHLAVLVLTSRV